MKKYLLLLSLFFSTTLFAQKDSLIYHPEADANSEVAAAIVKAKAENKHVVAMIGGNWCRWCRMFEKFRLSNSAVDSVMSRDFIFLHVNYSKENKNLELQRSFPSLSDLAFRYSLYWMEKGNCSIPKIPLTLKMAKAIVLKRW